MKCAVHVYDRGIHTSVYFVWLYGRRCLLLTWCAIKGTLLLFLIRTHKTSIIEETNDGNGLNQQEPTELMVHALWLPDPLYNESCCFLSKYFDNRYDRGGSNQKQLSWWQRPCDSLIPCSKHPTAYLTMNFHKPYRRGDRSSNKNVCSTKKKQ